LIKVDYGRDKKKLVPLKSIKLVSIGFSESEITSPELTVLEKRLAILQKCRITMKVL
jgi:hypothetical protein